MALLQLIGPLAISFPARTLPLERNSSFIATKKNPSCRASNNSNCQTISRRSANYQPSIWNHDYIQSLRSEYMEESYKEQSRILSEEVRVMLGKVENHLDQLEMIDVLQRLGVDYHFKNEIMNILDNIYNMDTSKRKKDLHATALEFRLLRQHGYDISTDVFIRFQDEAGSFKKDQFVDAEGMLSLYEASFHSWEDETILDEARDFTLEFLNESLTKNKCNHYLSLLISHALELPLHWRISRLEAHWFINVYGGKENMNPAILQLAILDFNIGQAIYQEELKYTSRWWKKIGLVEKLSFARDRLVESFIWTVGINFKPDFGKFRTVITKVNSLVTTIDDIYDVYGTLEELELFTEAIDKWDLNAIEILPSYMKICFLALYNFINDLAYETLRENGYYISPYLNKAWADICKSYLTEAKWYYNGYTPSFKEYTENAWISISAPVLLTYAPFLIPHSIKKEDLVYIEEYSNIVRFSAMISRLANDLASYKRENETGYVPKAVQCCMNETGASETEACEYIKSMMYTTWKKMNKEARYSSLPQNFIDTAVNIARMALCMYQHGDGNTFQDPEIRNHTLSLIIQPIPDLSVYRGIVKK
ncbi:hypothetical protein RIF29_40036 [Crotalaria pallida]|uniref:Uncharacterized protein n=1 Tax=Crotalaria pallida TaxID=3830 RepID=A0AAN9E401_CROPI